MTDTKTIVGADGLRALVGEHIGTSDWIEVGQDEIDRFADATGDHQWIHVDQQRAAEGPFGGTIAHGFFTLALIPRVLPEVLDVTGFSLVVNYGLDKVRFPAPVPVDSRVRGSVVLDDVTDVPGGVQVALDITFEIEGGDKPACVARFLERRYE